MAIRNRDYRLDLELNDRHFAWGDKLFATDIDGILVEHNGKEAVALIDYKYDSWREDLNNANLQVISWLADGREKPHFLVKYLRDPFFFTVIPLNRYAKAVLPQRQKFTEREWSEFLHSLRGEKAPASILSQLADE